MPATLSDLGRPNSILGLPILVPLVVLALAFGLRGLTLSRLRALLLLLALSLLCALLLLLLRA